MSEMTKAEKLQFTVRLDNLRKIVTDESLLRKNSNLVQDCEWGGADLIVTTNPERDRWDTDVFVVIEDIKPILWLIYEFKRLFDEFGGGRSKYTFYPYIGESINNSIKNGRAQTLSILVAMLDAASLWVAGEYNFERKTAAVSISQADIREVRKYTLECIIDRFKSKSGKSGSQPERYSYGIKWIDEEKIEVLCSAKPSSQKGLRSLDPWLMHFVHELESNGGIIGRICVNIEYDEKKETLESLSRRLSYLCINNKWEFELHTKCEGINTYESPWTLLFRDQSEIVRTSVSDYGARNNNTEGRIEKDFQTFFFGTSDPVKNNGINTNERLAIFGEDFFNLKNKTYPIAREFPTGAFDRVISAKTRILPTCFIDFVTLNKYRQLSLIELKLNDPSMDSVAQILDYALFFASYKDELDGALSTRFGFKYDRAKKIVCYIANNRYHKNFFGVEKYYAPKPELKEFCFEFKKLVLGETTSFASNR